MGRARENKGLIGQAGQAQIDADVEAERSKLKAESEKGFAQRRPGETTDNGLEGGCPVCGKNHRETVGWHSTWIREGFDLDKDICEDCLFKLELPLLTDDGKVLGTLWLVKDLKQESVSHYTLRRIEHLRRTLIATLTNLQSADSADSRRLKNGR